MLLILLKKRQKKRGPDFRSPLDSCEVFCLHFHDDPEAPAGIRTTVGAGAHGTACDGGVYGTSAHAVCPHAHGDGSAAAGGHHGGGGNSEHCADPL